MMAQAVGVTQFVEGGGLAALQPAESGLLPDNFATAFGSAASHASDQARLQEATLPMRPVILPALPKTLQPSSQPAAQSAVEEMSPEASLPWVGAPQSGKGSGPVPPPTPAGGKLELVPRVTRSAPAAINNVVSMAVLPIPQPSSIAARETGVIAKRAATGGNLAASAKAEVPVVAPAKAIVVQAAPVSAVASTDPAAWSDTPPSTEPPESSLLQRSGAVVPNLSMVPSVPKAPAVRVEEAPVQAAPQIKLSKGNIAEGTQQANKLAQGSAKSGIPQGAAPGPFSPLPLALPPAPAASPVAAPEAVFSAGAANTPGSDLSQPVGISSSTIILPAAQSAAPGVMPRVPVALSAVTAVSIAAKMAGANITDKAVGGDGLGKTESSGGDALKLDALASMKQDSAVASSPAPAAAVASSAQLAMVVPAPITPVLSGHSSLASDLSVSANVPSHTAETGLIAAAPTGLAHTTITASPTTLEVGVASGTHGWLKIRAELTSAGEVNASLTGGSPLAATKLRGELPALSSYLQAEQVQVNGLSVHAALHAATSWAGPTAAIPSPDRSGSGGADSFSTSADAGARSGQSQHQADSGGTGVAVSGGVEDGAEDAARRPSNPVIYGEATGLGDGSRLSPVEYGSGGGWLNVRV